jgi:sugar-specific transcriptional regulator TrmB
MTTNFINQALKQIGLDERQQKVYLALLEIGLGSVQEIAEKARLERTGVYGILETLIGLGLVLETMIGKKRAFQAQDPARLLELLDERRSVVSEVLPELQSLWTATDVRPRTRYFEGSEGMRTVLLDTLTSPDRRLLGILSAEDLFGAVGERWFEDYTKRRIATGFCLRVIRSKQKEVGKRWPSSAQQRREVRYAPSAMVFSMTMYIYGNKVGLLSTRRENFGLIIESDEFATHQSQLFEALWQISQPGPTTQ